MVSFSFSTLIVAVLVLFVVLTVKPVKDIAYAATENTAKVFGIDIGNPRIGSFSATPVDTNGDSKWEMKFELSVAGNKNGAYLEIYESKASDDKTATQLEPPPAKFGDDDRIYSSRRVEGKLEELAKKGVFNINCPADDGCRAFDYVPKRREDFKPDLYKFSAVIRKEKGNKVVYSKDAVAGLYDEQFVELLNKPVQGCRSVGLKDCNVIECKKARINNKLYIIQASVSAAVNRIVNELISGTCVKHNTNPRVVDALDFNGCTDKKDIDAFNTKFTRVRMLIIANDISGATSENDYIKFADKIEDYKRAAISDALFCTQDPGGAYGHLNSVGWIRAGTFVKWSSDIEKELNTVLSNLKPGISGIRADAFDDRHLGLSWKVPLGENMVKAGSYKISRFHKRWERGITLENQRVLQKENIFAGKDLVTGELRTSFNTDPGLLAGKHEFEVRIFEKPDALSSELFLAKASTGLFDDAYIETYKGGVDGKCVTKGLGKDPAGLHECNIDAQKREELATLNNQGQKRGKVLAALGKAGVGSECKYQKSGPPLIGKYWLSDACTPEEVDRVWKYYLSGDGRADDYDCVLPLSSEAKSVCIVKRQTVSTLLDRDWKDLRVSKGWEENV